MRFIRAISPELSLLADFGTGKPLPNQIQLTAAILAFMLNPE